MKKCITCGTEFDLTDGELSFYKEKGFQEPKRCAKCRKSPKSINTSLIREVVNGIIDIFNPVTDLASDELWEVQVSGERTYTVAIKIFHNAVARVILYNRGEIANAIRNLLKVVGKHHNIHIQTDVVKDIKFDSEFE